VTPLSKKVPDRDRGKPGRRFAGGARGKAGVMPVFSSVDRIATLDSLDPVLTRLGELVQRLPERTRDALHGVWLGHPLHPALAQLPVGLWTSAALLDALAAWTADDRRAEQAEDAAGTLIAAGLASAPLAALAGLADWSRLDPPRQRIGAVHAALNGAGIVLTTASLLTRRNGRRAAARWLSVAGAAMSGLAAGVGGHLSYRHSTGASHAPDMPVDVSSNGAGSGRPWHPVTDLPVLVDGRPARGVVDDVPVVVVRQGDQVHVMADTCSHLGGPLSQGQVEDGCIVCPWHGSAFRLADGSVRHGPATAPQPAFEARLGAGDQVEARPRLLGRLAV